jgi:hypothetical protein
MWTVQQCGKPRRGGVRREKGIRSSAVDAERGYSEERWYSDDRGYPEPERRESRRGGGYDDDRRAPAQRGYPEPSFPGFESPGSPAYADPGYGTQREPTYDPGFAAAPASPPSGGGLYGPRPADRPALPPQPEPTRPAAGASRGADEGVYRSGEVDEGVYRSRKPLHAAVLGIFLGAFELIMVLQFVKGVFGFDLHRVLSGGLTLLALPAFGIGFYALLTGAAHGGPKAFLKTPLAYLPVGLLLLVAAGAAA